MKRINYYLDKQIANIALIEEKIIPKGSGKHKLSAKCW